MTVRIFTAAEKLGGVNRELGYRRRVFERRVAEGKMQKVVADREIALFEAIAADYAKAAEGERLL